MHRLTSAVARLTALALMLGGVVLALGTSPASTTCHQLTTHGVAKRGDGTPLVGFGVAIFLHNQDVALAHGRAGSGGGFSFTFCKGDRIYTYAKRHNGVITVDFVAHAWKKSGSLFSRANAIAVGARDVTPGGTLTRAFTVEVSSSRTTPRVATGEATTSTDFVHPGIMAVEAVRGMRVEYSVDSSGMKSIAASIGVGKDSFGAGGEMAIDATSEFGRSGSMRVASADADGVATLTIKPELAINAQYSCYQAVAFGGIGGSTMQFVCDSTTRGAWTGGVTRSHQSYVQCNWGRANTIGLNNRDDTEVHVGSGATFTASVSASMYASSIRVTTTYGAGTGYRYAFDKDGTFRKFCVGGDGSSVSNSGKLYISRIVSKPGGGCNVASGDRALVYMVDGQLRTCD